MDSVFLSLNIPFADLDDFKSSEPNQCRFMAAEEPAPLYLCCGHETSVGLPYCPHHQSLMRVAPRSSAPASFNWNRRAA